MNEIQLVPNSEGSRGLSLAFQYVWDRIIGVCMEQAQNLQEGQIFNTTDFPAEKDGLRQGYTFSIRRL